MNNPYKDLFNAPGAAAFVGAGLLGRIALPMTGIGIITMLSQRSGSYALAGGVAAAFVMTYALMSPQTSRLVDRHGQSRVLPLATLVSVLGFVLLACASAWQAASWLLFAGAVMAGVMPSVSAMVRARWSARLAGQGRLQTAYSLETVLDEVTFIVGPPLAVGLSLSMSPEAGVIAAALLLALGVAALLSQRKSEPPVAVDIAARRVSVIRLMEMRLLTLLLVAMGLIVGTVDIVSVAFAEQLGQPAMASLVLAAYATGSCLAGLAYGAVVLSAPLGRQLLWGGLATAVATVPLLFAGNMSGLALTVLVAGVFFAPTMIVAMSLVERIVPEQQLTEGMTWVLSGLNAGVALGAAVSGRLVDSFGAQSAFGTALCAGLAVALVAAWVHARLTASPQEC